MNNNQIQNIIDILPKTIKNGRNEDFRLTIRFSFNRTVIAGYYGVEQYPNGNIPIWYLFARGQDMLQSLKILKNLLIAKKIIKDDTESDVNQYKPLPFVREICKQNSDLETVFQKAYDKGIKLAKEQDKKLRFEEYVRQNTTHWRCVRCGRDKFTKPSPHKCNKIYRKRCNIFQPLDADGNPLKSELACTLEYANRKLKVGAKKIR